MWGLFVAIGGFIVGLFQGGVDAVVAFLSWAVGALEAGAILLWNGLKAAVELTRLGFVKAWDFVGNLYDDVLKPAWDKISAWFDRLHTWLDNTFGPLLKWLIKLRTQLLAFWKTYVRPWLDIIDVTRKLLRTLGSLGLTWATALDQRLGDLESAIEKPFQFVLGKLNEIINVVNTVITADGLFQRVALIKSLARDYQYAWTAITQPYLHNQTPPTDEPTGPPTAPRTLTEIADGLSAYVVSEDGLLAPQLSEMQRVWRSQLGSLLSPTNQ